MPNLDNFGHEQASRIRDGDTDAFAQFIRTWDQRVLALCYRMTGNHEDAQDLRQEAFLRAHRGIQLFDGKATLSTWMYRVTLNTCHDFLRKRRATDRIERVAAKSADASTDRCETSASLARTDAVNVVASALEELRVSERDALVMRHYLGMTFPAIAEIVGEPITTIKSRVLRGLQRMRDLLGEGEAAKQAE